MVPQHPPWPEPATSSDAVEVRATSRPRVQGNRQMFAAANHSLFALPDAGHVPSELDVTADMLGHQFPRVEAVRQLREFGDIEVLTPVSARHRLHELACDRATRHEKNAAG